MIAGCWTRPPWTSGVAIALAIGVGAAPAAGQSTAAEFAGRWAGALDVLGQHLEFSVTFQRRGDSVSATIDIPAQNARGISLREVTVEGDRIRFELPAGPGLAIWDGERAGDVIEGEFTQGGARGTFRLNRVPDSSAEGAAGTDPGGEDRPFVEEEILFRNGDIELAGTLTLPRGPGPFPAAVLVTGSGPQNRDEELFGFRPFKVIAEHLARRGIATLRYDDRGVGGSSGSVAAATTSDFAEDALAAIARLDEDPRIAEGRVGILGHSEGGVVAPLAASRSDRVAFLVLLAGTAVSGEEILYEQGAAIARASDAPETAIVRQREIQERMFGALRRGEDLEPFRAELEEALKQAIAAAPEEERAAISDIDEFVRTRVEAQLAQLSTPWFRYFLDYDPAPALRRTHVPVLALFGELDLQVLPSQNREPMARALAANSGATIEVVPQANHLFQQATTGSPDEYATLEKAFVPGLLDRIADWILSHTAADPGA